MNDVCVTIMKDLSHKKMTIMKDQAQKNTFFEKCFLHPLHMAKVFQWCNLIETPTMKSNTKGVFGKPYNQDIINFGQSDI